MSDDGRPGSPASFLTWQSNDGEWMGGSDDALPDDARVMLKSALRMLNAFSAVDAIAPNSPIARGQNAESLPSLLAPMCSTMTARSIGAAFGDWKGKMGMTLLMPLRPLQKPLSFRPLLPVRPLCGCH
jgi:hypothetical protein